MLSALDAFEMKSRVNLRLKRLIPPVPVPVPSAEARNMWMRDQEELARLGKKQVLKVRSCVRTSTHNLHISIPC